MIRTTDREVALTSEDARILFLALDEWEYDLQTAVGDDEETRSYLTSEAKQMKDQFYAIWQETK